jgi:hypothetical protein
MTAATPLTPSEGVIFQSQNIPLATAWPLLDPLRRSAKSELCLLSYEPPVLENRALRAKRKEDALEFKVLRSSLLLALSHPLHAATDCPTPDGLTLCHAGPRRKSCPFRRKKAYFWDQDVRRNPPLGGDSNLKLPGQASCKPCNDGFAHAAEPLSRSETDIRPTLGKMTPREMVYGGFTIHKQPFGTLCEPLPLIVFTGILLLTLITY